MPAEDQIPAVEFRAQLNRLQLERLEAKSFGLGDCQTFMSELEEEIATCRSMFVLAAVTELAVLRADISGEQVG